MDIRIIDHPAFRVVGRATRAPFTHGVDSSHIRALFAALPETDRARLTALGDIEPAGVLQACAEVDPDWTEGGELTQVVGVALRVEIPVPGGFDVINVPAGSWAVLRMMGPHPAAWASVVREWLPGNPWRLRFAPEIVSVGASGSDTTVTELWIPVERE